MLFLSEKLLNAAGLKYDQIEDTWMVPEHLPPVVTVEADESGKYIMESLLEVHSVLESAGCSYSNFAINGGYVSVVGLTKVEVAAAA